MPGSKDKHSGNACSIPSFIFVIQGTDHACARTDAQLLNNPKIKGKGIFRTLIFLPCNVTGILFHDI